MNRRTLDLLFSAGGVVLGALLLVLGLVLNNQASFANDYVKDQLSAQKITFTPAANLHGEDAAPGGACLAKYAETPLDSGKKAECYANQYIAFHMRSSATEAGVEGATYATLGSEVNKAKAAAQEAKDAGQPTEELDARVTELSGLRDTMFKGETLRGLLLTSYGFSIFGDRAGLAATVCFIAFGLMILLSIAGFIHAASAKRHAAAQAAGPQGELVSA
ncbi:MAG TPA: hypothetical protein VH761_10260 [Ilumatobacteraceae bacterium]|jgi:hypothetical protein